MRTTVCLAFLVVGISYLLPNDAFKGSAFIIGGIVAYFALKDREPQAAEEAEILPEPETLEPYENW